MTFHRSELLPRLFIGRICAKHVFQVEFRCTPLLIGFARSLLQSVPCDPFGLAGSPLELELHQRDGSGAVGWVSGISGFSFSLQKLQNHVRTFC
jgi:hypothetical protein